MLEVGLVCEGSYRNLLSSAAVSVLHARCIDPVVGNELCDLRG